MTPRAALTLAAALLAPVALAQAPAAPEEKPAAPQPPAGDIRGTLPPPRLIAAPERPRTPDSVLQEVVGTVRAVDRAAHRITVATAAGDVTLHLDRNTLIYGPGGLVTVLDVVPGATVRAGRDAGMKAYWVTVTARPVAPAGPAAAPTGPTPVREAPPPPPPSRADPG